jgi:uncharacterized protein (TIGR02147 family)
MAFIVIKRFVAMAVAYSLIWQYTVSGDSTKGTPMVSVFDYTDYRLYLKAFYEENKQRNPAFSYRYIARRVGFKSPGHLTLILQGKTNISNRMLTQFITFLGLKKREAEYFELLVNYDQAKGQAEKKRYFERIAGFKGVNASVLSPAQYEFYRQWYYSAILDLLEFYQYRGDSVELARMIQPPITPTQARKAIELLDELALIRKCADGHYEVSQANLSVRSEGHSVALANYASEMMNRAREALDALPREERSISWAGFSASEATFERICEETRAFRRRILSLAESDTGRNRAYHINIQIFPTSRPYDAQSGERP